ncbi:hypothetical protein ACXYMO_01945 [Arenibacterium sp. CAU 1754]
MKRFASTLLIIGLCAATPALAGSDVAAPVVTQVEQQGYAVSEVTRTWLGRVLITARSETHLREVVLNRTTGQVLRDQLFPLPSAANGSFRGLNAPLDAGTQGKNGTAGAGAGAGNGAGNGGNSK